MNKRQTTDGGIRNAPQDRPYQKSSYGLWVAGQEGPVLGSPTSMPKISRMLIAGPVTMITVKEDHPSFNLAFAQVVSQDRQNRSWNSMWPSRAFRLSRPTAGRRRIVGEEART